MPSSTNAGPRSSLPEMFEQIVRDKNIEEIRSAIDPEFVGIMPTGETVHGFDGLKAYWDHLWADMGEKGEMHVRVRQDGVPRVAGDVALANGQTDVLVFFTRGKQFDLTVTWTATLHHVGPGWKVLQITGTIDPINNQIQKTGVHSAIIIWSGVGLLVGVVIGIAGYRMLWAKKETDA